MADETTNVQIEQAEEPKVEASTNEAKAKDEKPKAELKYTEADVNKIIESKLSRERQKYEDKLKAEQKKLTEAQKLEQMNETEKANYKVKQLEDQVKELTREKSFNEQMGVARKVLSEQDINVSDPLLAMIVSDDAETTKTNVDQFAKLYKDDVNKAVKQALKQEPPKSDAKQAGGKSRAVLLAEKYNQTHAPKKPS